jgi:hypothetical protein
MASPAELSSIATSLEELTRRVTGLGEAAQQVGDDDHAAELFAVERALTGALRRLHRVVGD